MALKYIDLNKVQDSQIEYLLYKGKNIQKHMFETGDCKKFVL